MNGLGGGGPSGDARAEGEHRGEWIDGVERETGGARGAGVASDVGGDGGDVDRAVAERGEVTCREHDGLSDAGAGDGLGNRAIGAGEGDSDGGVELAIDGDNARGLDRLGRRGAGSHSGAEGERRGDGRRLIHDPLERVRHGAAGEAVEHLPDFDRAGGIAADRQRERAARTGRPVLAAIDARLPRRPQEEPGDRDRGVVGDAVRAAATSIGCQCQRGQRQRHHRSRFCRIVAVADAVDGPRAEDVCRSVGQPAHRGGRGKTDVDRSPRGTGERPVFHLIPHDGRVIGHGGVPRDGGRCIGGRGDHICRHAGHVGQRDRKRRGAVDLVGQQRVVGQVRELARRTRHARLSRRRQDVFAHWEDGRRLEHHTVVVLEIPEQVVGALDERDAVAGQREGVFADRRRVDAHADVIELERELGDAAGRLFLQPDRIGVELVLIVRAVVERVEQHERRLRRVDAVDRTAVDERVAAEARQAGLRGVVAAELTVEVAGRGDDRRLRDADGRCDGNEG